MNNRFDIQSTSFEGLNIIRRNPVGDTRGYLERMFCETELRTFMCDRRIVQINHALTAKCGTVRGLHYQRPPYAEIKFVSCLLGTVFDVAVDLRKGSSSFLQWHAEILSESNHKTLVIPEGFAHGFQALTDNCQMLYLHTAAYTPEAEGGLFHADPRLQIHWPEKIKEVSARDAAHPLITDDFDGIRL